LSQNHNQLIYHKGGDVVIVDISSRSSRGNVVTAYGDSGIKGSSGAEALGGLPSDQGATITEMIILGGQIPTKGGFFPPAIKLYP
jgi:hypothetical protein